MINFGTSNTSRYYTTPNHADWDLPNGEYTLGFLVKPQTQTSTKYFVSSGTYRSNESINGFLYNAGSGVSKAALSISTRLILLDNDIPMDAAHWICFSRRSDDVVYGIQVEYGQSSGQEKGDTINVGGQVINLTGPLEIGRREDGNVDRYWKGSIDRFFLNKGYGATLADIEALAGGTLPADSALGSNGTLTERVIFDSSTPATITGEIVGHVFTKQGTGYGADEASPYDAGSSVASSDGTSTASGVSVAVGAADAAATGSSTASGTSNTISTIVGTSDGVSTVTATGSAFTSGAAAADGLATALVNASSIKAFSGDSVGTSTVTAFSSLSSTALADGTSTTNAFSESLTTAAAQASGTSTTSGLAGTVSIGTIDASGAATSNFVGQSFHSGVFDAAGTATATAGYTEVGTSMASADGTAIAAFLGRSSVAATCNASASSSTNWISGVAVTTPYVWSEAIEMRLPEITVNMDIPETNIEMTL